MSLCGEGKAGESPEVLVLQILDFEGMENRSGREGKRERGSKG